MQHARPICYHSQKYEWKLCTLVTQLTTLLLQICLNRPFGYCVGTEAPEDPGFINLWYWLKKAVYNTTKTFNGQKVDTWSYEVRITESDMNIYNVI